MKAWRHRRAVCPGAMFGLILLALPSAYAQDARRDMLSGARCADAARDQLRGWSAALDRAIAEPPDPLGDRAARVPTGVMGVWVRMAVDPGGEVVLERVTAAEIETHHFGPTCEPVLSRATRPVAEGAFTDRDLAARLAQGDTGVILVWSPHMPLSVDQYAVLAVVTKELGLSLVTVLDPGADVDYARRAAAERQLPSSATQPIGGIELAFRGMTTHAPSVQVFADGRLKGRILYGYRSHDAARLAITEVLRAP